MRRPHLFLLGALLAAGCASSGGGAAADDADLASGGSGGAASMGGGGLSAGGNPSSGGGVSAGGGTGGQSAPACLQDLDCPGGARCDEVAGACRPACRNDFDCGDAARCRAPGGFCESLTPCGPDRTCGDGSLCNCHGVCEPLAGTPCKTDLQCPVEAYCDPCVGACKSRVAPCGPCGDSSAACERPNDLCLPVGAAGRAFCLRGCAGQATCDAIGPGLECREVAEGQRACVPTSGECVVTAACGVDLDCGAGQLCNESGQCQDGCTADNECPGDGRCEQLRCQAPCGDARTCDAPGECQADGHCRVPGGCLSSADCAVRETHCDLSTHLCAPGCERDVDCLSASDECVDGRCRPRGCVANFQCAFGEVCEQGSGLCKPAGGHHCESPCDPMADMACGGAPNRCLSLQDSDGNALGDFCFEACQRAPNECPQGYQCVDVSMSSDPPAEPMFLCIRRCDQEPVQ